MGPSTHVSKVSWLLSGVFAVTGCGGSNGDGSGSVGGTVTEPWAAYCTGTFTQDTPLVDAFDEPTFTARAGDEFLLSDFSDGFGGRAEFL